MVDMVVTFLMAAAIAIVPAMLLAWVIREIEAFEERSRTWTDAQWEEYEMDVEREQRSWP